MRYCKRVVMVLLAALLFGALATVACANSAEPPGFTVIVANPPEDLSLSLELADGKAQAVALHKEQKAWEAYYRFFYNAYPSQSRELNGATLIVQSGESSFLCPLPADAYSTYNNLMTLDMEAKSLSVGQSAFRVPLLVALRVVLTLLIEGAVFFLFGYRKKNSWLAFFIINIITQAGLNALLTGPGISSYWIIGFILGEIVVLAVELIAFALSVKEFRKRRVIAYTVVANVASLLLGGLLITYLPV